MDIRNLTKIVRNMMLYKNSADKNLLALNENEFEMLRYITKREYRSLKEITDYLNVDKSLVTRMCKKLIKLDYITIEDDPSDSRKKLLKATKKTFEIKNDMFDREYEFYNSCLKVLTPEEKENFSHLIDKVYIESKRLRKNKFQGVENEKSKIR